MIPKAITRDHIVLAAGTIDKNGVPKGRESRRYGVVIRTHIYPPKYLISLASIQAGCPIKPGDFGGGVEANEFLRRLGFTVRKGTLGSKSPLQIKVARVWLDMGVSMASFRKHEQSKRWGVHKRIVIGQFRADEALYKGRLSALAGAAVAAGADVLVLPACAIVHTGKLNLAKMLGATPGIVVSGALDLSGKTPREYAIIAHAGRVTHRFDAGIKWCAGGAFSIMAAISSTIRKLCLGTATVKSKQMPPRQEAPVLLLDVGHHPYSSRYLFQTLRRASECAEAVTWRRAVTVLSSWRYARAQSKVSWSWPLAKKKEWKTTLRTQAGDVLDLIAIDLS